MATLHPPPGRAVFPQVWRQAQAKLARLPWLLEASALFLSLTLVALYVWNFSSEGAPSSPVTRRGPGNSSREGAPVARPSWNSTNQSAPGTRPPWVSAGATRPPSARSPWASSSATRPPWATYPPWVASGGGPSTTPVTSPPGVSESVPCYEATYIAFAGCFLGALPALWLVGRAYSQHLRLAAVYALLNWAAMQSLLLQQLANCGESSLLPLSAEARSLLNWPALPLAVMVSSMGFWLAAAWLAAVESSSLKCFCAKAVKAATWANALVGVVSHSWLRNTHSVLVSLQPAVRTVWLVATAIVTASLLRALLASADAARRAPAELKAWARSVRNAVLLQSFAVLLALITSAWSIQARIPRGYGVWGLGSAYTLPALLDMAANDFLVLLMSGALSGAVQGTARRRELARERRRRRQVAKRPERGEAWDAKVEELAWRGISVAALLRFYKEQLPAHMPGFKHELHTTRDVAYEAIMPFSKRGRCAAAPLLMGGANVRPQKMVTHSWKNLFRDLVAGVLADAFEEGEFCLWAQLLAQRDFSCLEDWVERAGVSGRTYWICCFSVNQHGSICHAPPNSSLPACDCGLPKVLNDTPPLLGDKSIPCELNKFDDMLRLLAATADFEQAMVADAGLDIFNRAWCISELATCHELGLVQDLRIRSKALLTLHEDMLRGLKVQSMEASRLEDKVEILGMIEDHDAFNEALQRMIFQDLLPGWSSLDGKEKMVSAGNLIRWGGTRIWAAPAEEEPAEEEPGNEQTVSF